MLFRNESADRRRDTVRYAPIRPDTPRGGSLGVGGSLPRRSGPESPILELVAETRVSPACQPPPPSKFEMGLGVVGHGGSDLSLVILWALQADLYTNALKY